MIHLQDFPELTLVPIDDQLAEHAGEIAATFRIHGADAIYVQGARLARAVSPAILPRLVFGQTLLAEWIVFAQ